LYLVQFDLFEIYLIVKRLFIQYITWCTSFQFVGDRHWSFHMRKNHGRVLTLHGVELDARSNVFRKNHGRVFTLHGVELDD